jgi:hypothetical protein
MSAVVAAGGDRAGRVVGIVRQVQVLTVEDLLGIAPSDIGCRACAI